MGLFALPMVEAGEIFRTRVATCIKFSKFSVVFVPQMSRAGYNEPLNATPTLGT